MPHPASATSPRSGRTSETCVSAVKMVGANSSCCNLRMCPQVSSKVRGDGLFGNTASISPVVAFVPPLPPSFTLITPFIAYCRARGLAGTTWSPGADLVSGGTAVPAFRLNRIPLHFEQCSSAVPGDSRLRRSSIGRRKPHRGESDL